MPCRRMCCVPEETATALMRRGGLTRLVLLPIRAGASVPTYPMLSAEIGRTEHYVRGIPHLACPPVNTWFPRTT